MIIYPKTGDESYGIFNSLIFIYNERNTNSSIIFKIKLKIRIVTVYFFFKKSFKIPLRKGKSSGFSMKGDETPLPPRKMSNSRIFDFSIFKIARFAFTGRDFLKKNKIPRRKGIKKRLFRKF